MDAKYANISWLNDWLATGGDFSFDPDLALRQYDELIDMDINLVIDCRREANDSMIWKATEVEYLHLPTEDRYGWRIPPEHFDAAVAAARPVIEGRGKVFVHCHMGVNRGPSTALAVLLDHRYSPQRAYDLIREKRPEAGLVYATDAFAAHMARRGTAPDNRKRRMREFRQHIDRVFGPDQQREVRRVIRENAERDEKFIDAYVVRNKKYA